MKFYISPSTEWKNKLKQRLVIGERYTMLLGNKTSSKEFRGTGRGGQVIYGTAVSVEAMAFSDPTSIGLEMPFTASAEG